ncbi:extracellular solute-binding protein [Jannaschia pohangensis]|uniref:Carbohydrate ABC transporter substrate-binding protein, CUT1 family n=1 Tax=Jannaschia pohangensis TaxID=390807 RepID=A0A1I3HD48_9RHOB|nr:extracellular solute-binding protein [Jannaschia pohangensis]SFI33553.1 carbohydrate ABC transporter substrate-binding protein, CUT1 family [Jannaschia pohangensis]
MRHLTLAAALLTATAMAGPGFADGHLRIVDEPLELTIHMHWRRSQGYQEDYPVEAAAAEMTGISLKDATVGTNTTESREAHNLLIASGNIPDIFGGDAVQQFVNEFGPQGAFLPLNDLIDEHAPNIKAFMEEYPERFAAVTAADGNLYYIPYFPDGFFGRAYFIRQDWLDALGLEQPQNVEELKAVLEAFRDQDPNGNGLKDEIPFFGRDFEEMIRLVTLWDGRSSGSDTYHDFLVEDGKVTHPYIGEGYREGMANLAEWYAEGLIDPEIFTRGNQSRDYLLSENLGGMTHDWFASTAGYNDRLQESIEGFAFLPFIPPASISGVRMEEHRRILVKPDGWAIGHTNEHPVETIKYFDFWFTEEGRRLGNFGIEGVHYDMVDGKPIYKDEVLNNDQSVAAQMYAIGAQMFRGYQQDYEYEKQWTNQIALDGIALYEAGDYLVPDFLGVSFTPEEQAVYDRYWPTIRTYMLERQQAWILGTGDIRAEWDDYLETLNEMGLDQVLEVMNVAYARQGG